MSLDPLTPHRHSLRDIGALQGVCRPIGVCVCVYLMLLPVPSAVCMCISACPTAWCDPPSLSPSATLHSCPQQSTAHCPVRTEPWLGDVSKQKLEERQRKRHKRALIVARPLGFLHDSRPLPREKHNCPCSIITTPCSHPYMHTQWQNHVTPRIDGQ